MNEEQFKQQKPALFSILRHTQREDGGMGAWEMIGKEIMWKKLQHRGGMFDICFHGEGRAQSQIHLCVFMIKQEQVFHLKTNRTERADRSP